MCNKNQTCFKSSSFFIRWNCFCFERNADLISSSSLNERDGLHKDAGDKILELGGTFMDGVLGRDGVQSRCGVVGRLVGVLWRCTGCAGVVGRLGTRGVCGRLDCKLLGVCGRLLIAGV